jgi:hypothetical protein
MSKEKCLTKRTPHKVADSDLIPSNVSKLTPLRHTPITTDIKVENANRIETKINKLVVDVFNEILIGLNRSNEETNTKTIDTTKIEVKFFGTREINVPSSVPA